MINNLFGIIFISINFNMQPPPPSLSEDIINKTSEKYLDIYKKITGKSLV